MATPGLPVAIHTPPPALEGLAELTRAHTVLHAFAVRSTPCLLPICFRRMVCAAHPTVLCV